MQFFPLDREPVSTLKTNHLMLLRDVIRRCCENQLNIQPEYTPSSNAYFPNVRLGGIYSYQSALMVCRKLYVFLVEGIPLCLKYINKLK
jgi:hypothetical protein